MQPCIGEVVTGPAIPVRHHHKYLHHLLTLLHLQIKLMITAHSTFYSSTNANGIGKTELRVVMENNKVNVAVIQKSKLTSISKNPCIHTQCIRTILMVRAEDYTHLHS